MRLHVISRSAPPDDVGVDVSVVTQTCQAFEHDSAPLSAQNPFAFASSSFSLSSTWTVHCRPRSRVRIPSLSQKRPAESPQCNPSHTSTNDRHLLPELSFGRNLDWPHHPVEIKQDRSSATRCAAYHPESSLLGITASRGIPLRRMFDTSRVGILLGQSLVGHYQWWTAVSGCQPVSSFTNLALDE